MYIRRKLYPRRSLSPTVVFGPQKLAHPVWKEFGLFWPKIQCKLLSGCHARGHGESFSLQTMHLFSLLIENVSKERLEVLQWPFIIFNDHTSTPHIILLTTVIVRLDLRSVALMRSPINWPKMGVYINANFAFKYLYR